MLIFYKNKGILVIVYLIVRIIGTAILLSFAGESRESFFGKIDFYSTIGIGFLFTGIWTYLTKDDFYKDRDGNKKKMDTPNELFWISMRVWAIIFIVIAVFFFSNLVFHFFDPIG